MTIELDATIQEIEARLLAVTPGSWRWIGYNLEHPRHNWASLQAGGSLEAFAPGSDSPSAVVLGVSPVELYPNTYHWIVPNRLEDLELIEHAKEDIELLLRELKAARQQLAELRPMGNE